MSTTRSASSPPATNGARQTTSYGYDADGDDHRHHLPAARHRDLGHHRHRQLRLQQRRPATSVTDFNGNQITISPTADGLPYSATLGSTGDTIATTYDNDRQPVRDRTEEQHRHSAVLHLLRSPGRQHPDRDRHPVLAAVPAEYTYDAQGRVTSMTPGTGSTLNYALRRLLQPHHPADWRHRHLRQRRANSPPPPSRHHDQLHLQRRRPAAHLQARLHDHQLRHLERRRQLTAYSDAAANMTAATYDGDGLRASTATGGRHYPGLTWNTQPLPSCSWTPPTPTSTTTA